MLALFCFCSFDGTKYSSAFITLALRFTFDYFLKKNLCSSLNHLENSTAKKETRIHHKCVVLLLCSCL